METLKIEFDKRQYKFIKYGTIIWGILFISSTYSLLQQFGKDVETFEWFRHATPFLNLSLVYLIGFCQYLPALKIQRKFPLKKSLGFEIPIASITGVKINRNQVTIETNEGSHTLPKNLIIVQLDKLKNLKEVTLSESRKSEGVWLLSSLVPAILGLIILVAWISGNDLKFHLPIKQIEVVEVSGILKFDRHVRIEKRNVTRYLLLSLENHSESFPYISSYKLDNDFVKDTSSFTLRKGTPLTLKIRKEDLERFNSGEKAAPGTEIKCYEIKANGDLLLRKKGLKEK